MDATNIDQEKIRRMAAMLEAQMIGMDVRHKMLTLSSVVGITIAKSYLQNRWDEAAHDFDTMVKTMLDGLENVGEKRQ